MEFTGGVGEMQREYLWPGRLGRSVLRPYMVGGGRSE
jgi:hypothetical protein